MICNGVHLYSIHYSHISKFIISTILQYKKSNFLYDEDVFHFVQVFVVVSWAHAVYLSWRLSTPLKDAPDGWCSSTTGAGKGNKYKQLKNSGTELQEDNNNNLLDNHNYPVSNKGTPCIISTTPSEIIPRHPNQNQFRKIHWSYWESYLGPLYPTSIVHTIKPPR